MSHIATPVHTTMPASQRSPLRQMSESWLLKMGSVFGAYANHAPSPCEESRRSSVRTAVAMDKPSPITTITRCRSFTAQA